MILFNISRIPSTSEKLLDIALRVSLRNIEPYNHKGNLYQLERYFPTNDTSAVRKDIFKNINPKGETISFMECSLTGNVPSPV